MKKYVIARTGETVNIGDTIRKTKKIKNSFGTLETIEDVLITESNIDILVKKGVLKCIESSPKKEPTKQPCTLNDVVHRIAQEYKLSDEDMIKWMDTTNKFCPATVLSLLFWGVSKCLDGFYGKRSPLDDNKRYWCITEIGVHRTIMPPGYTASMYPVFPSKKDAETASELLKDQFKYMYG